VVGELAGIAGFFKALGETSFGEKAILVRLGGFPLVAMPVQAGKSETHSVISLFHAIVFRLLQSKSFPVRESSTCGLTLSKNIVDALLFPNESQSPPIPT